MNRYEVFIKVVECGSFTKAAEVLDYTQSAVSQMVHTLEEELSTVLLLRSKNGITLTADGEAYYPYSGNAGAWRRKDTNRVLYQREQKLASGIDESFQRKISGCTL